MARERSFARGLVCLLVSLALLGGLIALTEAGLLNGEEKNPTGSSDDPFVYRDWGGKRSGITYEVYFDDGVIESVPNEDLAIVAEMIARSNSFDFAEQYTAFQKEYVQKVILDKIERTGGDYEEMVKKARDVMLSVLPFDSATLSLRVLAVVTDETDPAYLREREFLERDLERNGLDPAGIERFLYVKVADEESATFDGMFRVDPTDPVNPDYSDRWVYRYGGTWYFDPRRLSDTLLDMAADLDAYSETGDGEGEVVWVRGSYCRVAIGTQEFVLYVRDRSLLSGVAKGDRIEFTCLVNLYLYATLTVEECDEVIVLNTVSITKK